MPKSLLESSLPFLEMKPLEYWLDDTETLPYDSKQDFDRVKDEEFLILHTSGSTGLPKPIKITHRHVAASDMYQTLQVRQGQTVIHDLKGKRLFCALPPFHVRQPQLVNEIKH
jgi:acyl-CoA synthetase (AMP-forming)/AMP-acid ligase II